MTTFSLIVSWLTIAISAANVVFMWVARKRIQRAAWIDGRIDLLQHMVQAHEEGLDFHTFVRQVAARDGFLLPEDRA